MSVPVLPYGTPAAPPQPVATGARRLSGGPWLYIAALVCGLAVAGGIVYPKAGLGAIAAGLGIYGLWRVLVRPFNGLLLALWIYPFYPMLRMANVAYGVPIAVPGTRPWCEGVLVVLCLGLLLGGARHRGLRLRLVWEDLPVLALLLSGIYASVVDLADHRSPLVPFFGWEVSLNAALFYIAVRWLRVDEKQMRTLIRTVLATYVIGGTLSLFDYFVHPEVGVRLANASRPFLSDMTHLPPDVLWRSYPRLQSILFDENVWGSLSEFVAIFCLATRTLSGSGRRASRVYWPLLVFSVTSLVLTISRGALIGLVVGSAALLLVRGRHRPRVLALVLTLLAVMGCLFAVLAANPRVAVMLQRVNTISLSSVQQGKVASDRVFQWVAAWNLFVKYPSGTGLGTAGYAAMLSKAGGTVVADGIFFRVLAEQGLPGALLFVFTLIGVAVVLIRLLPRARGWHRVVGLALLAFHCGFCTQSIAANTYDYYYLPAVFWMFFGCFVSVALRTEAAPPPDTAAANRPLLAARGKAG